MKKRIAFILPLFVIFQMMLTGAQKTMVGQDLPKLTVNFLGKEADLSGKPTIVEFWATWCPPCRKSIPHLNEIYKKYKERGLEIVGITDENQAVVEEFLKKQPIDYHVGLDQGGKYSAGFGIEGIPHAFLVSKAGKVVWEGHPMEMQDADIEKILK